jgi:exodeoxyribonuclease VII large subunit
MSTPDKIHLNVPFSQKDQAKMLGARWDPVARKWYVSPKTDLTPFSAWLAEAFDADSLRIKVVTDPTASGTLEQSKGISLTAFLAQVGQAIAMQVPKSQWVRAEISQFRTLNGGHVALELAELSIGFEKFPGKSAE